MVKDVPAARNNKTETDLKNWLKQAVQLETDTLVLNKYTEAIEAQLYNLAHKRYYEAPAFMRPSIVFFCISLVLFPLLFMGVFYAVAFFGTAIALFQAPEPLLPQCLANGRNAAYIGIFAGLLVAFIRFCIVWFKAENRYKKQLEEYKKASREEVRRMEWETALKARLEPLLPPAQKAAEETKSALDALYGMGGLKPEYQNLTGVATVLGYLQKGRCTGLEGKKGAYTLYKKEQDGQVIITNVYIACSLPDELELAQPVLYGAAQQVKHALAGLLQRQGKTAQEQGDAALKALELFIEENNSHIKQARAALGQRESNTRRSTRRKAKKA